MKKIFPLLFTFILLTACHQAPVGGSPVASTPFPTDPILYGPDTTPNVLNPYPTTLTVESVTFPANSGGGIDRETIIAKHGIADAVLKGYEDAAIQEAVSSGFQPDTLDKNYVDRNELWNMYLRDKISGNLLWSYRKADNAMAYQPLMWIIDAQGIPRPNPDYELRPIEGSGDSRIVYTPSGYVVEIAGPIVLSDGTTLYAQWRSVLTDALVDVPGAAALLPTETATPAATETPSYSETSRYFEPGFQLDLEGNVDGIAVPFTVGLHASIMNRAQEPVTSVTVNRPDTNDVYAKFWLTMCWKKYGMQHPEAAGMSFSQYEQLVKAGGGEIQIAAVDETTDDQNNKLLTFHPENGFVYIPVDRTVSLPEALNTLSGTYFGMNEKGQFVIVGDELSADGLSSIRAECSKLGYQPDFGVGYQFSVYIADDLELILTLDNDALLSSRPYYAVAGQGFYPDQNLYLINIINQMLNTGIQYFSIGK